MQHSSCLQTNHLMLQKGEDTLSSLACKQINETWFSWHLTALNLDNTLKLWATTSYICIHPSIRVHGVYVDMYLTTVCNGQSKNMYIFFGQKLVHFFVNLSSIKLIFSLGI